MDKTDLQATISCNLQKYRSRAHLTQEQVAERAGISTAHYANIERGKKLMSPSVLIAVANALHISVNSVLYEESSKTHIENICNLLCDKPKSFIIAAEGVLNALIEGFPPHQEDGQQ